MGGLAEVKIYCPYCGETLGILVDCSEGEQHYIEDCQVCCRPIEMHVHFDERGEPVVQALHEND